MPCVTPTATFTTGNIWYYAGDRSSLSSFLSFSGGSATNLSNDYTAGLGGHVITLTGQIYAAAAANYNFGLYSDDGSTLFINGALALDHDGLHSPNTQSGDVALNLGWNDIKIVQWENGGETALGLTMNGSIVTSSITRTAAVPGPIVGAGLPALVGLMGFAAWRRRRQAA